MSKVNDFILDTIAQKYSYLDKEKNVKALVSYMFNRSFAMFKYEGLPDTIPQIEIEKQLQMGGFGIWAKVKDNLYIFNGGLGGESDVYNMPTIATVSNPALDFSGNFIIDKDCIIMPNDSMYIGLYPMFAKYCTLINENDISMLLYDINKRASFILSASDDNTADSARDFLRKLFAGEQAVITDKNILQTMGVANLANSGTAGIKDLIEYEQYLKASMYNEIGLNSNFNMKRERLNTSEVEMNSGNLYPLIDDMLECRKKALEKINAMFGTNISVEFASSWTMRVKEFEDSQEAEQDTSQEAEQEAVQGENEAEQDTSQEAEQEAVQGENEAIDNEQEAEKEVLDDESK